jgi:secondary thiamine-phosphate synthase enzyme
MHTLRVQTSRREELIDISAQVSSIVAEAGIDSGLVVCFVPHTTAGITINENADPDVQRDILHKLHRVFPQQDGYHHAEGNSDAHIKASLMGASVSVIIEGGHMVLGQWQGIYFCEFDGPRTRNLNVKVASFA